jgi:hypothetical protein
MKKGILIQALGHTNYYQMAVVLAASIKSNEPDMPICLVTDNTVLIEHTKLFDLVMFPSKKSITQRGKTELIKAKLFMYDFSPFDETIFLDVDQIVIEGRKLAPIFDELKDVSLTFANHGLDDKSVWCDIAEVHKLYGNKTFWNIRSELVYFKKSKEVKKYFDTAKKVYEDNKITSATRFANATMADELAFQCAAIITGMYPHQQHWSPDFWYSINERIANKYPYELDSSYITYSIGGSITPNRIKNNYNTLAKHYFAKLNLFNPYQVVDKRNFLPERKSI